MATIATRVLVGTDNYDRVAIKAQSEDYVDKWGILEIDLTSRAGGTAGTVKIQASNFDPKSDWVIDEDDYGSVSIDEKFYIAVNNGVLGPAAKANEDGSYDLIDMEFIDGAGQVTLTYTLTFTEVEPAYGTPANSALRVDNEGEHDYAILGVDAADLFGKNGYVKTYIDHLTTVIVDSPADGTIGSGDSTPVLSVKNTKHEYGFGIVSGLIVHGLAKTSGTKVYTDKFFIHAVNQGKIDGNGTNVKASQGSYASLIRANLDKTADRPCDDHVDATLYYSVTFVEIA